MSDLVPRNNAKLDYLFKGWNRWSEWRTVMTKEPRDGFIKRKSTKGDLVGYKTTDLKEWIGDHDDGIYEWRKIKVGEDPEVVYVGKTKCKKIFSLFTRIRSYTQYASHERENINKALEAGYELQVRFLPAKSPVDLENRALAKFKYEWNDKNQKKKS